MVTCTPIGAISYISPVFIGSISDIELTRTSAFLTTLEGKPGISIWLTGKKLNIELNLLPFMEGRRQLPPEEVMEGQKIASLRIHVERAIGRLKDFIIFNEV